MSAQNSVSGIFEIVVTKDGDTIGGSILCIGNTEQQLDTATGNYIPDYTTVANKLILYPNFTSVLRKGTIPASSYDVANAKWYWDGSATAITTNSTFKISTYNGFPALEVIGNPMTEKGTYSIRGEFPLREVISNKTTVITGIKTLSLTETTVGSGTNVFLKANNGGVVDADAITKNCILTPILTVNGETVTANYQVLFSKSETGGENDWVSIPTNAWQNMPQSITITPEDVSGTLLVRCQIRKTGTTDIIATDVQMVIDNSDPLKMTMTQSGPISYGMINPVTCLFQIITTGSDATITSQFRFVSIKLLKPDGSEVPGVETSLAAGTMKLTWNNVQGIDGTPMAAASVVRDAGVYTAAYNDLYDRSE